ncbi:MAG: response regulator [Rhodobacteraceae bacterium]|nr:response regulator [Paracoccaceae bacterium]
MTPDKPDDPIEAASALPERNPFSLVSHDLRSALSDILGGLHLVDEARLDAETRAHFDRVAAAGEALARMLDKTLSEMPSRLNDRSITHAVNVDLGDFLNDVRRRWADVAAEKGVRFTVEVPSALPAVATLDRVSLERIIANLVGNAIKFTDAGTVDLTVSCHQDRTLCFSIRDDGPGLSAAALSRLYEYAGRPEGAAKPGSGLGLHIARELADLIGASLDVRNRDDGNSGTAAELRLPHAAWFDRSLRRESPAATPTRKDDREISLAGMNILLAEDNKTNQLVATQMLGAMGAEFGVASDGLEALQMLEAGQYDLALLDIEMPRMSGLELIKTIRSRPAPLGDMPLVALTAYVMREHRERIFAAGADGIIAKPLMSIADLGRDILDHYQQRRPHDAQTKAPCEATPLLPSATVDRAIFDNLVDTIGPDSTAELLGKLQIDTDAVAEGLSRGRRNLDLAEIRSQTHILISVAGAIGATRLQYIAQRLNTAANRPAAAEGLAELCDECLSGLSDLQGFIMAEQAGTAPGA